MGRIAKIWAGVCTFGGIVTIAAQTKPQDAISNLSGWAKISGLQDVAIPAGVDAFATVVGILLMAVGGLFWWRTQSLKRLETPAAQPPESPIQVADQLYVDADPVKDENGQAIEGVYSVALCLWVTNSRTDGVVLRNLQARLYGIAGDWDILPIRGVEDGTIDLRHGEAAVIEVGRVLFRRDGNNLLAHTRHNNFQIVDHREVDGDIAPKASHRRLTISNALGKSHRSIGQFNEELKFRHMPLIISADDTVSKQLNFQTDLFAEIPYDWLVPLTDDATDTCPSP